MCILMLKISKNSSTPEISWFVDNSQILPAKRHFIFLSPSNKCDRDTELFQELICSTVFFFLGQLLGFFL